MRTKSSCKRLLKMVKTKKYFLFILVLISAIALSSIAVAQLTITPLTGTNARVTCSSSSSHDSIFLVGGSGRNIWTGLIGYSASKVSSGTQTLPFPSTGSHFVSCFGIDGTGSSIRTTYLGAQTVNIGSTSGTTPTPSPTPNLHSIDVKILDQNNVPYAYGDNVRIQIDGQSTGAYSARYNPSSSTGYMRIPIESGKSYDIKMSIGQSSTTRRTPFIGTTIIEKVTYNLNRASSTDDTWYYG